MLLQYTLCRRRENFEISFRFAAILCVPVLELAAAKPEFLRSFRARVNARVRVCVVCRARVNRLIRDGRFAKLSGAAVVGGSMRREKICGIFEAWSDRMEGISCDVF